VQKLVLSIAQCDNTYVTSVDTAVCTQGWEALGGDTLGWLLDPDRPNLQWRVLVDLVGRPPDSPAVHRARGGANVSEPVASLLAELHPDGGWDTDTPFWSAHEGPGWRLIAAVQWGADLEDPRLHAASEHLLETAPGEGGLESIAGQGPDPVVSARALEALTMLGWGKHARVQEMIAWFEATPDWEDDPSVAVAVLNVGDAADRSTLVERAVLGLGMRLVVSGGNNLTTLGHPNFHRTDLAEIFFSMAKAGVGFESDWSGPLERLQKVQDSSGRWDRISSSPATLGLPAQRQPSKWVTLKATRAMLTYAVDACLPRVFPYPPK